MINILFALDNNFARHCASAMASILSNHKISSDEDKIRFFIVGNLSGENREKLISLRKIQDFQYTFIEVDESQFSKIPLEGSSVTICYRLIIPEIMPETVDKVIHLDCDLVVNTDIKNLWDINIVDYLLAAVLDEPDLYKKVNYFNAGVMVFNIKELRKFDFKSKWRTYVDALDKKTKLKYYDQDILNFIICNRVLFLEPNWNIEKYNLKQFFSAADTNAKDLYIIHYTTQAKPWMPLSDHPFKDLYIKYAKMTAWKREVGEYSFTNKFFYVSKILFRYWKVHPIFFIKPKFWIKVRKEGLLRMII
jgi:lipopolysaccharide biosynthesis glycosyltransferase